MSRKYVTPPPVIGPGESRLYPDRGRTPRQRPPSEDFSNIIIAWILQVGVIASASIITLGMVLLLLLHPGELSTTSTFPHTFAQVWTGLLALQPQAIVVLGLLLLIATPVLRVAVSIAVFLFERDYRYVGITLLVLAILVASFLIGKGGG